MTITEIVEIPIGRDKKKTAYKLYIDYNYAFLLYRQDIKEYQLEVSKEVSSELYDRIIEETVYRRAKQKALAILKYMDRTVAELRIKLKEAYYNEDIIDQTIKYLEKYNYLNDERYASYYISARKYTLSKRIIKSRLIQKGINNEILEKIILVEYNVTNDEDIATEDAEVIAIKKAISKKCKDLTSLSWEEKQKLMSSLYRKGFDSDKIYKCMNI